MSNKLYIEKPKASQVTLENMRQNMDMKYFAKWFSDKYTVKELGENDGL